MNEFLSYFGARKYKSTRGYSAEWIAKKIMEKDEREAIEILKVWTHRSRRGECTIDKVQELNEMTDDEVIIALKALKEPHILRKLGDKQLDVRVKLTTTDTRKMFYKKALIDSGCSSSCISQKFIQENHLKTHKLPLPITCYNADGSTNKNGSITETIEMRMSIGDHEELIQLSVTNIGNHDIFLGYDWLQKHNSSVNWKESSISLDKCHQWCRKIQVLNEPKEIEEEETEESSVKEGEKLLFINMEEEAWRRDELNIRKEEKVDQFEEVVPKEYWGFRETVFDKKMFDQLPPRRPWDHAIELTLGASLKDYKVYPLSIREQEKLDKFLDEHLKTGCIRPSKSSCAVPFFFVKKKDGSL